jgi:hypothetical protein
VTEEHAGSLFDRAASGPIPRWLIYVLIPGFVGPALILVFIFLSELAHDEGRCPYTHNSTKSVNDQVSVREDRRSCVPGIEERRFSVMRGASEQVLGRRRFARSAFAPEHYQWSAALTDQGDVRVTVDNAGHEQAQFREGTAEEHAR